MSQPDRPRRNGIATVELALEFGLLGRNGLDYASTEAKYTLKSLPDEQFTGLHMMRRIFAAFKRIAPEHDLHIPGNNVAAVHIRHGRRTVRRCTV